MQTALRRAALRLEEVETQLAQPETYDDPALVTRLSREQKELTPLVDLYRQWEKATADLVGLEALLADPECRDLAQAELPGARETAAELEARLKALLRPRDPLEGKDVFLEIRAGVGGEEAALFAADLYRMYAMYGEKQGWQMELVSVSHTELGGIKELSCQVSGASAYLQPQAGRPVSLRRPGWPGR